MYFLFVLLFQVDNYAPFTSIYAGGPLTTFYGTLRLVGIMSYGLKKFEKAVYTKVSAVHDWIIYACSRHMIPIGLTTDGAMP